jgi:CRP-like cAMP-binding protein
LGRDEALFHQGNPGDTLFLIKGGRVRLTKTLENGKSVLTAMFKGAV